MSWEHFNPIISSEIWEVRKYHILLFLCLYLSLVITLEILSVLFIFSFYFVSPLFISSLSNLTLCRLSHVYRPSHTRIYLLFRFIFFPFSYFLSFLLSLLPSLPLTSFLMSLPLSPFHLSLAFQVISNPLLNLISLFP